MTGRNLDASSTFEEMCVAFEQAYAQDPTGLLCECCQEAGCESCKHASGWNVCQRGREALGETQGPLQEALVKWKAGTLHGDKFDVQTNLWFLARRLVPLHVLKEKLDVYIAEGRIAAHEKDHYAQVFEQMLGQQREPNLHGPHDVAGVAATTEPDEEHRQMNEAELRDELGELERQMRTFQGQKGATTDQMANLQRSHTSP